MALNNTTAQHDPLPADAPTFSPVRPTSEELKGDIELYDRLGWSYYPIWHEADPKIPKEKKVDADGDKKEVAMKKPKGRWGRENYDGRKVAVGDNIAIIMSRSMVFALDFDQPKAELEQLDGWEWFQKIAAQYSDEFDMEPFDWSQVTCVKTPSGGRHYYFKVPRTNNEIYQHVLCRAVSVNGRFLSLDNKCDESYCLCPPSCKADGRRYEWVNKPKASSDVIVAPEWLTYILATKHFDYDEATGRFTPSGKVPTRPNKNTIGKVGQKPDRVTVDRVAVNRAAAAAVPTEEGEVSIEDLPTSNPDNKRFVVDSNNAHVLDKLFELIDLDGRINGGYQSWLDLCFAMHSVYGGSDEGLERFLVYCVMYFREFESDADRYKKEAGEKWASSNKNGGNQLGLTTLINWAVEDLFDANVGSSISSVSEALVRGFVFDRKYTEKDAPAFKKNPKHFRAADRSVTIDPKDGIIFDDYMKALPATVETEEDAEEVYNFIKRTLVYVTHGANPYFMAKTKDDGGNICYQIVANKKSLKQITLKKVTTKKTKKGVSQKIESESLLTYIADVLPDITYQRVNFIPTRGGYENPEVFNIFTGFLHKVQPELLDPTKVDEVKIAPVLRHLREVLCAGNEELYRYVLCWLARKCQYPAGKSGVMLVIRSKEGAGKTLFWDFIGNKVIGPQYYLARNMEAIVDRFNSLMEAKLLVVVAEMHTGQGQRHRSLMKELITDFSIKIERKGLEPVVMNNYSDFVGLTTSSTLRLCPVAAPVESPGEQRFASRSDRPAELGTS